VHREELTDVVRRVGWDQYVVWDKMIPYFQTAKVGLVLGADHPNQIQKIPTKFYEYLHFGLPILCSDFPVWRRFIEQHHCGAVVPPGDAEAAVQVLKRWQSHPEEYRALSAAARRAAQEYRWETEGQKLLQVYDTLLTSAE
jgi:glycosyltransferase involved in cell wall biosynthesis